MRLLSTPRVSTQNNVEAEIAQGVQIPYQTVSNNTVTAPFKDAALTLKVIPQITEAGTVIMKIAVDNGSVGEHLQRRCRPSTRSAPLTTVLVNDGQTTVIGGIYSSENHSNNDRDAGSRQRSAPQVAVPARCSQRRELGTSHLHHASHHQGLRDES